jgi:outer membrane receptor protein involved in Fe transport
MTSHGLRPRPHHLGVSAIALAVAVGLTATLGFAGGALAADAPAQPPQPAPGQANAIGEVLVTATKEAQAVDVAKVSLSIAAYSQQALDKAGVQTLQDLFTRTPGVNFTRQAAFGIGFTSIAIRGVQSRTSQPTTGIYINDTPLYSFGNNTNLGGSNAYPIIFDLNSVEILRGPQGTLFGSGSEGGTVRFLTNEPSVNHASFYGKGEFSGTDHAGGPNYEAGAAAGGPLVQDKLGFRISADFRHDGGWVDHCVPAVGVAGCQSVAESNANTIDTMVLRGALLWKPVDWLSVEPSLHYQKYHQANPSEIELAISNPDQGVFRQAHSKDEPISDQLFIPTLKLQADLPGVVATSSTSYVWRRNRFFTDYTHYQDFFFFGDPYPLTGAPDDYGLGTYGITQNDFSEEFRLASNNPGSRLSWVVGAFFDSSREFDFAHVVHPDLPDLILKNFGVPISAILGVDPYLGTYVAFNEVRTTDKQEAVFASADYKLMSTVKLTVGGRFAHYSEHVNSFIAGPFNGTNGETFIGDTSGDTFDPKAAITWQPNDQSLLYVSGAKGYRPGGYNAQVNNAQPACQTKLAEIGLTVPRTYSPDSIWSVEAGAKERLLDNHLAIDFSVYHNNWDNIQLSEQISSCGFGAILNLGSATTQGFDLALQSRIGDHIKFDLAVGYTEGHFTSDAFVGDPNKGAPKAVSKGDQISGLSDGPAIPPWTVTATFEYDFMLAERSAYLRFEDTYHSKNGGPFSQRNPANVVVYDPMVPDEPENNIINLRVGMIVSPGADLSLFVDNLADSHPLMSTFHVGQFNAAPPGQSPIYVSDHRYFANTFTPRTWGVNLVMHF